ncbi:HNH endonuclease [Pseudomonas piscis]|uniref:HNH endonuclease n=1 Tax=Pseudomonas piscis TaxID=2614538 RepID=UPI0039A5CDA6
MPIREWYLNITELPAFDQSTLDYLQELKPHKAKQWDLKTNQMKAYKASLLEQLLKIQNNRCVYCGTGLRRQLVDREHFAHKDQKGGWPEFMFITENLFAACGYCNRMLKGTKSMIKLYNKNYRDCEFHLIHPYFDTASEEISFVERGVSDAIFVKKITQKGEDTIDFFELDSASATARRAGYITEIAMYNQLSASDAAEVKAISHFRPE